jgi:hypothetical protein
MGMFDYVRCKMAIPGVPDVDKRAFQTKSLECWMHIYEIREDGSLWVSTYSEEGEENFERSDLTGEIVFYDYIGNKLMEFVAVFVDGRCLAIRERIVK